VVIRVTVNTVESDLAPGSTAAQIPSGADDPGGGHTTSITEAGSFTTARCSCGWFAPARRSRDKSRRDADAHTAAVLEP
jgi:hypothetical protein